jgi:peptide/nickel transport system substrate-binding protein
MKSKKLIYGLIFTFLLTMVTAGGVNPAVANAKTSKAVKDKVTLVLGGDIATLDPQKSASTEDYRVFANIFDTLIKVDKSGKFIPSLASSWKISKDGKKYTFTIRKGVKFHNGIELTASDVVFTFERAKKSPYMAEQVAEVGTVKAIGNYVVEINLKHVYAPFLLSLDTIDVLSEKTVNAAGAKFGEKPIGTGPYKFVSHSIGQKVILVRNDNYFKGKASIKNVEFKVITDENTALIALQTGEVDFSYQIPVISKQTIANDKKLAIHEFNGLNLTYVLMNNSVKPFNNKLVRQAMNYAIDKESIVLVAEEGMGTVTQSIFSKDVFGYSNIKGYEYSPEKAKALLTKAGYPNGFKITFKTMDGPYQKAAQRIQEDLRKIGVTVDIVSGEKNAYIQDLVKGNYEMGNISCSLGKDADFYGIVFKTGEQANFSKYSNPKVDSLFKAGKATTDVKQRLKTYASVAQLLSDDGAIVPLYYPKTMFVGKSDLKIGLIDPVGIIYVYEMSWK